MVSGEGAARADVVVRGGRIADVLPGGGDVAAETTVDAGGLLVLPGMVDTTCI